MLKFFYSKRGERGFTLIELLVVIAIIGILATIVLVSLNTARQKARDTRRVSDMRQVALALEMYYDDNSAYPGNTAAANEWADMETAIEAGGYITSVPTDPSGGTYQYYISTASSPQNYVLGATLEGAKNNALCDDIDATTYGLTCDDTCGGTSGNVYCISP